MQPVLVTWRLVGERRSGTASGLADLRRRRHRGQAGRDLRRPPARPEPQPSWWLGPLTGQQQGRVTVLAGSGQPADRWARLAVQASAAVGRRLPAGVADRWDGRVVVEVPATVAHFAAVLGQSADAYARIAAVAYQAGVGQAAPLRDRGQPASPDRGRTRSSWPRCSGTRSPIVAARSPESAAPLWAVEGLAEWVAVGDQPGRSSSGTADLLAEVRAERAAPIPAVRCRLRGHLTQPEPRVRRGLAGLLRYRRSLLSRPARPAVRRARPRPSLWTRPAGRSWASVPTSSPPTGADSWCGAPRPADPVPRTLVVTNDFPPRIGGIESFVRDVCTLLDHDVVVYASGPPGASATDAERGYPVVRAGPLLLPTRQVAAEVTDLSRSATAPPGSSSAPPRRSACWRPSSGGQGYGGSSASPMGTRPGGPRCPGPERCCTGSASPATTSPSSPTTPSGGSPPRSVRSLRPAAPAARSGGYQRVPARPTAERRWTGPHGRRRPARRPEGLRHPAAGLAAGGRPAGGIGSGAGAEPGR